MRVKLVLTDEFGEYGEKMQQTVVTEDTDGTLDDVLMVIIRGLIGHSFTESTIQKYINYDPSNYQVCEIDE
jgi:hypothetical protein